MGNLRPRRAVAAFDSATAMLRATANALRSKDFAYVGRPAVQAWPVRAGGFLPAALRRTAYSVIGAAEGIRPDQLGDVDMERIAEWVVGHYERTSRPGVVIGSSNGAAVHLCAETGMPWLPQTLLLPVRWAGNDPDNPDAALRYGSRIAPPLLERNPDVTLHHMHDGNQDRLMVSRMMYFRVKWWRLPQAYRDFLADCLPPGAPIVLLDDRSTWPTTTVADRHVFQTGAQGGLDAAEYLQGSPRLSAFLREQGASRRGFPAPEADGVSPESEWGFDFRLGKDIETYAAKAGHPVVRIALSEPQELSDPTARLMRERIRVEGGSGNRLLVESFVILDAVQAFRTGAVPYWTFFGVESAYRMLRRYLIAETEAEDPYTDVDVAIFPHGVASAGVVPPRAWADLGAYVSGTVRMLSGTTERWPSHFDTLQRYGPALRRMPDGVLTPFEPGRLSVKDALSCLKDAGLREITGDAL